jgi:ArsR family transcriptional regulator
MDYKRHNYLIKTFKALANSNRLKIVDLLCSQDKEILVGKISESLEMPQALVSQHLAKLREAEIVKARQDGLHMYYSIKDKNIAAFLKA